MAKTNKASKKVREDASGVDFEFANGAALAVNVKDIPKEIQTQLMLHGISQKIGDSYSGAETPELAHSLASGVLKRLVEGEWSKAREGGGGRGVGDLIEAMFRLYEPKGKTREDCAELVTALDEEKRKELKQLGPVKRILAKITAEKAAKRAEKLESEADDEEGGLEELFAS